MNKQKKYLISVYFKPKTNEEKKRIMRALKRQGIPQASFYRYMHIQIDAKQDIPTQKLFVIASELSVNIEDLINYEV